MKVYALILNCPTYLSVYYVPFYNTESYISDLYKSLPTLSGTVFSFVCTTLSGDWWGKFHCNHSNRYPFQQEIYNKNLNMSRKYSSWFFF